MDALARECIGAGLLLLAGSLLPAAAAAQSLPDAWGSGGGRGETTTTDGAPQAQDRDEPPDREDGPPARAERSPARAAITIGIGGSLRSTVDPDLQQTRWAPPFLDVGVTWITAGYRRLIRHGPSMEVSTNLGPDGAAVRGILPWRQWVVAPGWVVRVVPSRSLVPRWFLHARVSVPWAIAPDRTWGLSGSLGATFMVRAALGIYTEFTAATYVGGATRNAVVTRHGLMSLELGLIVDLEWLR